VPAYRAVVFDFFGTLTLAVRRGPAHAAVARSVGCDPAEFTALLDRTFRDRATGRFGSAIESLRQVARTLGAHPSERDLRAAAWARVAALRMDTRLRPQAVPLLRAVRARGLRTALVSDCTHELPGFQPALPVTPLLYTCAYSVEVGACKPSPGMYLAACDRLDVAPDECLYVGDGGGRELTGASALGMTAIRLAAPDLAGHLTFAPDLAWSGRQVYRLQDTLLMLARTPVPGIPDLVAARSR